MRANAKHDSDLPDSVPHQQGAPMLQPCASDARISGAGIRLRHVRDARGKYSLRKTMGPPSVVSAPGHAERRRICGYPDVCIAVERSDHPRNILLRLHVPGNRHEQRRYDDLPLFRSLPVVTLTSFCGLLTLQGQHHEPKALRSDTRCRLDVRSRGADQLPRHLAELCGADSA